MSGQDNSLMLSNNTIIRYVAEPTGMQFHASNSFVRGIMGPIGCMAPDTLIVTDQGQLPISAIDRPMNVLSWNDKKCEFQFSPTGGSFQKGIDYLYRVTTPSGEFDAAGHHLLLCADGKYRRVDTLRRGQMLSQCCAVQPEIIYSDIGCSLSLEPILSIKIQKVENSYWDMQVAGTNNYVTVDGAIHHNSGKSVMCVWEMFERCKNQKVYNGVRKSRWAIMRNTYPELRDTTLNTFLDWIPEMNIDGYSLTLNRQPPMRAMLNMRLKDGTKVKAEFIFLALDTEDDVKKLKSLELTGGWMNEASEMPFSVFKMARGRVRRFPSVRDGGYNWSGIIMDTNPPEEGEDVWWYKLAEIEQPLNYRFWKQPPALLRIPKKNPKDPHEPQQYMPNVGQGQYPAAENVKNHTAGFSYWLDLVAGAGEDWVSIFILGEYGSVQDGKPVYPEYFDEIHLARDENGEPMDLDVMRGLPLIIGVDFGLTPCVAIAQQTPNGVLRVIDEMVSDNMGIRQFARDMLKPHLNNNYYNMQRIMLGDPAGSQRAQANDEVSCLQELANAGLPTEMARTNAFIPRREAVAGFMTRLVNGKAGFQLSKKCKTLRAGFKGKYQYRRMRTTAGDSYSTEPLKNHPFSDVHDALHYLSMYAEGGSVSGIASPGAPSVGRARQVKPHSSAGWD